MTHVHKYQPANSLHALFNHLNPTGYVMHQQFNIQQLYALPTLYLCVLYLSENKQRLIISYYVYVCCVSTLKYTSVQLHSTHRHNMTSTIDLSIISLDVAW